MFFASAKNYAETIKEIGFKSKVLIIRMRHVPFIDSTGLHNLKDAIQILKSAGVIIILSGVNDSILKEFEKCQLISFIKESMIFDSFDEAINHSKNLI